MQHFSAEDTIVALATPQGVGAIGVIRLSGKEAISITNSIFKGKDLSKEDSHTIHFGTIRNADNSIVDEVLVSLFIAPKSFTKENVVEISCHGSSYIIRRIIELTLEKGARLAKAGEFTQRAFLNGQFDLAQAEAVADLIHAESSSAHKTALNQMRGGFSAEIKKLREELIHFASMIELELDFGEEDVEFASRDDLKDLINKLNTVIKRLMDSFKLGNVIKNGIPTVIAGKPNAGKSTLLNALLNEEKAIVSDIPGTTRDFIEDELVLGGVSFRFIDTAGLRETTDKIESLGVQRTQEQMKKASLIIYLFDLQNITIEELKDDFALLEDIEVPHLKVGNKIDAAKSELLTYLKDFPEVLTISAKTQENLDTLRNHLLEAVQADSFETDQTMVTNLRHYQGLQKTHESLNKVLEGIDLGITNDFLAMDIRQSLYHLGEITGEITTEDLLDNIFSKFCIGK